MMTRDYIKLGRHGIMMYFPIAKVAESAYMQTSLMGRAMDAETKQFLLESLQLTPDKKEVHSQFVEEALFDVADRLSNFLKPREKPMCRKWREVRTPHGQHFFSDTNPIEEKQSGGLGLDRVALLSYINSTLFHYEDHLLVQRGDCIYEPVSHKYYLCLEDGELTATTDLQDPLKYLRIPCFEIGYICLDKKRWANLNMLSGAYNAIERALTDYVLYKWLLLAGDHDMAQLKLSEYSADMDKAADRLNSQAVLLNRRMNII